jgi:cyclic pyranopterin phosphate synthase
MTPVEIEKIVKVAAMLGVSKVKLTGGEPLLRDDIVEIIQRVSPHVDEVSMTTNAHYLASKAKELKAAGLKRVNISFHSAQSKVFEKITGLDILSDVIQGVKAAIEYGLKPVKLNMVAMKGINEGEILDLIEFARCIGAVLQLIEYQPLERGVEGWDKHYFDLNPLERELESRSNKVVEREMHRRKQYYLKGGGIVEVVRPMHNSKFCNFCTRLRLTSDGYLKPCLMRDGNYVDLISLIRKGAKNDELVDAFREAVSRREPFWWE